MPALMSRPLPSPFQPLSYYPWPLPHFTMIVYGAMDGTKMLYVGQSYRMITRVCEHGRQKGSPFDRKLQDDDLFMRVKWRVLWIKEFKGDDFVAQSLEHHAEIVGKWLYLLDQKESDEINKYGGTAVLDNVREGNNNENLTSVEDYIRRVYNILVMKTNVRNRRARWFNLK